MQKRLYPRCRLVVDPNGDESDGAWTVTLEETVVKDILVVEFVGQCQTVPAVDVAGPNYGLGIDCARFCNVSRFLQRVDRPNLQLRRVTVAGATRTGLFATRRITSGERLTVGVHLSPARPVTWLGEQQRALEGPRPISPEPVRPLQPGVIDLCDDEATDPSGEAPLCPCCLVALLPDRTQLRVLVHCRRCFTVLHYRCACLGSPHLQSRLLEDYVCHLCVPQPIAVE